MVFTELEKALRRRSDGHCDRDRRHLSLDDSNLVRPVIYHSILVRMHLKLLVRCVCLTTMHHHHSFGFFRTLSLPHQHISSILHPLYLSLHGLLEAHAYLIRRVLTIICKRQFLLSFSSDTYIHMVRFVCVSLSISHTSPLTNSFTRSCARADEPYLLAFCTRMRS